MALGDLKALSQISGVGTHTGEQWGVVGQSFAAIGCLGGALLVWTGLSLALRRLANALRRARVTREVHVPARA